MWFVQASNQTAMMTGCGSVLWCAANPISIHLRRHFAHDLLMFCDAISRIAKSRFSRTACASRCRLSQPRFCLRSSSFRAAVVERFGACCDSLVGFIRTLCGDGDRDALRSEDFTFSASSRTTYMASLVVFGAVISDAAMIDRIIGMDVQAAATARENGPRHGRQRWALPGRREVEGTGGRFWYELGQ